MKKRKANSCTFSNQLAVTKCTAMYSLCKKKKTKPRRGYDIFWDNESGQRAV